jgi:hypothetical protein
VVNRSESIEVPVTATVEVNMAVAQEESAGGNRLKTTVPEGDEPLERLTWVHICKPTVVADDDVIERAGVARLAALDGAVDSARNPVRAATTLAMRMGRCCQRR